MKTLEEIRVKYPRAHYAPDPSCKKCKGEGSFLFTSKVGVNPQPKVMPCACIFLAPEYREQVVKLLSESAKRILNETKNPLSKKARVASSD